MLNPAVHAILASEYNSTMDAVSWSMRSLLCAAPGNRLIAADFANIEGRFIAWLAGEDWKLQAFRDYDTFTGEFDEKGKPKRKGPDLYLVSAAKTLGTTPDAVTKAQRQAVGKPSELGLSFGGGPGAFVTMLKNGANSPWIRSKEDRPQKVTLGDVAKAVREAVHPRLWTEASELYARGALETAMEVLEDLRLKREHATPEELADAGDDDPIPELEELTREIAKKNRLGLAHDHWVALRVSVDLWRQSNFSIARLWGDLEDAAFHALENPGQVYSAGAHIRYAKSGDFLKCRLPSGRTLAYPYARIEHPKEKSNRAGPRIVFEGVDTYTKRWGRQETYGGKLGENVTQAGSRDVLRDAMFRLRKAGYRIPLHVHDEIVAEMPIGAGSLAEMSGIMREVPPWAAGLPVAVDGWEGRRYRK